MSVNNLSTPLSGMNAAQFRQNVTANNVANVSTPGFQPAQTRTADAAYINSVGQGTTATAMPSTYAPQRPTATPAAQTAAAAAPAAAAQQPAAATAVPAPAQPQTAMPAQTTAPVERPSNVDMITETTNRMQAQNAYGVSMTAARAMNGMSQTMMNMQG
jgi:flagellar hook protein FlgE